MLTIITSDSAPSPKRRHGKSGKLSKAGNTRACARYRAKFRDQYRAYQREYMRRYRADKAAAG